MSPIDVGLDELVDEIEGLTVELIEGLTVTIELLLTV